jgi:hypothetical protein
VSDNGEDWCKRYYVGYIDGAVCPYACVELKHEPFFLEGGYFTVTFWKYARPIQKKHKIVIDGKEIEISEEKYQVLKENIY